MAYTAIGIKFPVATYKSVKSTIPQATVYRILTSFTKGDNVEVYYIVDLGENKKLSVKQLKWFGDIKIKISRKLNAVKFELVELDTEITASSLSGETYTLKSLSDKWKSTKVTETLQSLKMNVLSNRALTSELLNATENTFIKTPQLIPFCQGGKEHENLYKTLCIYDKRLYYEKLFMFEYLQLASNIYARDLQLLPKEVHKITVKAHKFIAEQIELHPEDFRQRLEPEELAVVKTAHGQRLQQYNDTKRADNIALVSDAIESGYCYKSDGATVNGSAVAKRSGLSRVTVSKILKNL